LQITRNPALKAEVNRLQRSVTSQLNDRWSNTLESLDPEDQSLEDDYVGDENPHSITSLGHTRL
jgi:hypothetical protein